MPLYLVRRDAPGKCEIWNYKRREWCMCLDILYTVEDGFAYTTKEGAAARAHAIQVQEKANAHLSHVVPEVSKNVRVIRREAYVEERETFNREARLYPMGYMQQRGAS